MSLPKDEYSKITSWEEERVDEKDEHRQKVEWVVNWKMPEKTIVLLTLIKACLSDAKLEEKIFFSVKETSTG